MDKYYCAIDIGASSGRVILFWIENKKIGYEEVHRFQNQIVLSNQYLVWEHDVLFNEILVGLKKCKEINKIPYSVSIDTWGVDFVLLDETNHIVGKTICYRDDHTIGIDQEVNKIISEYELYQRTGIQKLSFNTIYQLVAIKNQHPDWLKQVSKFLMIPDYFNYLLTNQISCEYTNASTTQLLDVNKKDWDYELLEMLGLPNSIFPKINQPGYELGEFSKEIQLKLGYSSKVVLTASHDTGSAVVAVPMKSSEDTVYISSGTWSLLGLELNQPMVDQKSFSLNFTNEGGYNHTIRFLKNIMGLWLIQRLVAEFKDKYSYSELSFGAEYETINSIIDCNDAGFLAPKSMRHAIDLYCESTNQQIPRTPFEYARVVYRSLALSYKKAIYEIEDLTNRKINTIYIVGGGSQAEYLCQLIANYTECMVIAGLSEGTAYGNAIVQMIASNCFYSLEKARECLSDSFVERIYRPKGENNDTL